MNKGDRKKEGLDKGDWTMGSGQRGLDKGDWTKGTGQRELGKGFYGIKL